MAVATLIAVDCYLRPSEMLTMTRSSLVPPAPETGESWSLFLHPSSIGARSKVGESDETMVLNSRRLRFLTPVLEVLANSGDPQDKLWAFDYGTFYKTLAQVGRALGVPLVPYVLRHSGVTIDRAEGARTAEEAQKRGRWRQAKSMRRYEKAGRLADSWRHLRGSVQQHCRQMSTRIAEIIVGGSRAPPIPA